MNKRRIENNAAMISDTTNNKSIAITAFANNQQRATIKYKFYQYQFPFINLARLV
jgi:hypothetical protein